MQTILFSCLILITCCCLAQNRYTDTSATVVSYWKKGDIRKYEIKEHSTTYTNDSLTKDEIEIDTINFFIADETAKSYLIEWEYLGHYSNDTDALKKKISEKLTKKFGNVKLEYSTAENGTFTQIENWEKLSKAFSYAFDEAIKSEKKNDALVKIFQKLKVIYKTKQGIENIFNKYVNTYHYLYGLEYFKNNPYYIESSLPNMFGGEPFPAQLAIKLDSVNTEKEIAYISINQSVDKEKARTAIISIIEMLTGKKSEGYFITKDDLFMINDKMKYSINLPDGWIVKHEFIRTVKADNVKNITKISINLLN